MLLSGTVLYGAKKTRILMLQVGTNTHFEICQPVSSRSYVPLYRSICPRSARGTVNRHFAHGDLGVPWRRCHVFRLLMLTTTFAGMSLLLTTH
jgi:hypothetical protein